MNNMRFFILLIIISYSIVSYSQENNDNTKFKINIQGLKFKTNIIKFECKNTDGLKYDTLRFYNTGSRIISMIFDKMPKDISAKTYPSKIAPQSKGYIVFSFNPKNGFGQHREMIFPNINGKYQYYDRFIVETIVSEHFSSEKAEKPVAVFEPKSINFGEIKEGQIVKLKYILRNKGNSNLFIRFIKSSCGCSEVKPTKTIISPGDSCEINGFYDSTGHNGIVNKSIYVMTNDPENSSTTLRFSAVVFK